MITRLCEYLDSDVFAEKVNGKKTQLWCWTILACCGVAVLVAIIYLGVR
jgi:hypothetical protein